jgi:PhnB protein
VAEGALIDRLDHFVDTILQRGDATGALRDHTLAPLVRVAADLRDYPSPEFKARLRANLERKTTMSSAIVTAEVREGFTTITPYVTVRGAGLLDFLTHVFGAVETHSARGSGGGVHREVRIGNSMIMIGEIGPQGAAPFRPAEFHVYVEDVDAAFQRALAAGGTSLGEPAVRPYGERAGFVKDAFGNHWFIATHLGGSSVPEGLRTLTPFLHAAAAVPYIAFLKQAFGAVEEGRHDAPGGRVMHAQLRIGNAAIELGEAEGPAASMPGGFYLYVGDVDAVYGQALAAGAKSLWPPTDQQYGDRVGAVEDSIGNQWFIARPTGTGAGPADPRHGIR